VKEDDEAGTRSTHGEMETFSQKEFKVIDYLKYWIVADDNIKIDK
jgi:hypothetical protein